MARKIILNLAISLDGYISDPKGGFDWIVGQGDKSVDTEKQFSFSDWLHTVDVIVMGKNAFLDSPAEGMESFKHCKILIASNEKLKTKYPTVEFIEGDLVSQVKTLKEKEGKNIWIYGGAILADPFIKANVIDEYIIGIIPTILGEGKKLFLDTNPNVKLHLNECTVQDGIIILKYNKRI